MDDIRKLIAGADPLGQDSATPDPEDALRSMLSRLEASPDRVYPNIPTLAERRKRRGRITGFAAMAAAAATAGVLLSLNLGPIVAAPEPANTSAATPSATPRASATASTPPEPTVPASSSQPAPAPSTAAPSPAAEPTPPAAAWGRFSSPAAGLSFDVPAGWTALDVPAGAPGYPAAGVQVRDGTGKTVADLYYGVGGGRGGSCGPEAYTATELDSAPYAAAWDSGAGVRFSYRVLDRTSVGGGLTYQAGLVDRDTGRLSTGCLMYSGVTAAPGGTLTFGDRAYNTPDEPVFRTMADAIAYMATAEYRNLKQMVLSLSLSQ